MSADDEDLFEKEMGDVKRLRHNQASVKRPPSMVQPSTEEELRDAVESGDVVKFIRPGVQTTALRKLRRGQFPVEATLDLHGFTVVEASAQLQKFIQHSQSMGRRAVRIIHGKGQRSEGQQPVLKAKVNQWLQEFPAVLAFASARPQDGGTGAVDVLLRK